MIGRNADEFVTLGEAWVAPATRASNFRTGRIDTTDTKCCAKIFADLGQSAGGTRRLPLHAWLIPENHGNNKRKKKESLACPLLLFLLPSPASSFVPHQ
jgi:hypothetical protein